MSLISGLRRAQRLAIFAGCTTAGIAAAHWRIDIAAAARPTALLAHFAAAAARGTALLAHFAAAASGRAALLAHFATAASGRTATFADFAAATFGGAAALADLATAASGCAPALADLAAAASGCAAALAELSGAAPAMPACRPAPSETAPQLEPATNPAGATPAVIVPTVAMALENKWLGLTSASAQRRADHQRADCNDCKFEPVHEPSSLVCPSGRMNGIVHRQHASPWALGVLHACSWPRAHHLWTTACFCSRSRMRMSASVEWPTGRDLGQAGPHLLLCSLRAHHRAKFDRLHELALQRGSPHVCPSTAR